MAQVHRDGDEEPASEPCPKSLGSGCNNSSTCQSVLVQVYLHGRNAGEYCRLV